MTEDTPKGETTGTSRDSNNCSPLTTAKMDDDNDEYETLAWVAALHELVVER